MIKPAEAASITLTSNTSGGFMDTYISEGAISTNYGGSTRIVFYYPSNTYPFLWIDASHFLPSNAILTNATLQIYPYSGIGGTNFNITKQLENWEENNKDGIEENASWAYGNDSSDKEEGWDGGRRTAGTLLGSGSWSGSGYKSFDLTYLNIQTWITDNSTNFGVTLFPTSTDMDYNVYSREGSFPPRWIFEYSTGTAPQFVTNQTIPVTPAYGNTVIINANVNDTDGDTVHNCSSTLVAPNGTSLWSNINMSISDYFQPYDINWSSNSFEIDDGGNWTVYLNTSDGTYSNSSTLIFNIVDSTAPTIVSVDSPINNSVHLIDSSHDINVTWTDDMRGGYSWFNVQNKTNNAILQNNQSFTYCGKTSCTVNISQHDFPVEPNMSLNIYVNDTSGNQAFLPVNLSVTSDTSPPNIIITEPNSTFSSYTVDITFSITDNVNVSTCYYNITKGGVLSDESTILTNCTVDTTLILTNQAENVDYTFTLEANDSSDNWNRTTSTFSVDLPAGTTPSTPPGGGGGVILKALGQDCTTNEQCASGICDLEKNRKGETSENYQTCVTETCGNRICAIEPKKETFTTCSQDCAFFGYSEQITPFMKYIGIGAILLLIYVIYEETGKKQLKGYSKYFKTEYRR